MDDNIKVEESIGETGHVKIVVSSPKFKAPFEIYKVNNGFSWYSIKSTKGQVAEVLGQNFTTPFKALDALKKYINDYTESVSVRRDRVYKENHPDDSSTKPNKKVNVRKRSSD